MANINIIDYEDSEGELREIYDDLIKKRGKLAEIHKAQSLNPKTIKSHMQLYMDLMFGKSPLKRYQREMIGVVVSYYNDCKYCQQHHGDALNFFWKDENKIEKLKSNPEEVLESEKDILLCELAKNMTIKPKSEKTQRNIDKMKESNISEREILDTILIVSYFNFVNRIVLGTDIGIEQETNGYKYE